MKLYHGGYVLADARIVHDQCGSYADWYCKDRMSLSVTIMFDRYLRGEIKPNYPVPATASTAALSIYHQDRWPNTIWPYVMVKNDLKYFT